MLEISSLTVSYYGKGSQHLALNKVNLKLEKGMIHGVVGESGAGKSTLVNAIMQILPRNTSISGGIAFNNIPINRKTIKKIRGRNISYISQNFQQSLSNSFKIKPQFDFLLKSNLDINKKQRYTLMCDTLSKLNFSKPDEVLDQYPFELSGGMIQRIVIAMAIANSPKLIIADEPTSAIDLIIINEFLQLLKNFNKNHQASILIISHDLNLIRGFCDEVSVLLGGIIIEKNKAQRIFSTPCHPYTKLLLKSRPNIKHKCLHEKSLIRESNLSPCPFYAYCLDAQIDCREMLSEINQKEQLVRCNLYNNHFTNEPLSETNNTEAVR